MFPSAFDANTGFFEAVLTPEDAIISDELNHASLIDGIRLCKAKRFRFKHMDMEDLEKCLKEAQEAKARITIIVTDGVFSMDGDIAPLPRIVELAKQYKAYTLVDECHASGVLGDTGRGTPEYYNLKDGEIDIITSTLGKALGGGTGGYATGRKCIIDILRQRARPNLFSNSIAPSIVGASLKVFEIMSDAKNCQELVQKLRNNTRQFREGMR